MKTDHLTADQSVFPHHPKMSLEKMGKTAQTERGMGVGMMPPMRNNKVALIVCDT